jgi:thiamine-phosphate pyrophosphorylase
MSGDLSQRLRGFYAILDRDDPELADLLIRAGAGVNDRLDVALAVGADAVHLGQDDLPLADARRVAQGRLLIGVSTHDEAQVRAAVAGGADYLGFGPVYATGTKENPDPVQGTAGLARAVAAAGGVPIVAIGGITVERAAEVAAAGATAACAIAAVNGAKDPEAAGRAIACAFASPR